MKKRIAARKNKKKLNVQWAEETGFRVVPSVHQQTKPRLLKHYTISIFSKKTGPRARPQPVAEA